MTLTEFLLARIAEDEVAARAATPGPWADVPMGSEGSIVRAGGNTIHTARKPATCREFADAEHISRHDPARVLAECEAKRAAVEKFGPEINGGDGFAAGAEWALMFLALPYADHPDYRDEWRP